MGHYYIAALARSLCVSLSSCVIYVYTCERALLLLSILYIYIYISRSLTFSLSLCLCLCLCFLVWRDAIGSSAHIFVWFITPTVRVLYIYTYIKTDQWRSIYALASAMKVLDRIKLYIYACAAREFLSLLNYAALIYSWIIHRFISLPSPFSLFDLSHIAAI